MTSPEMLAISLYRIMMQVVYTQLDIVNMEELVSRRDGEYMVGLKLRV